ncbi:MAG: sulfatase-like hydrolase/transferase [Arenicellaceae bacterium]|nr:sulfatase-like hydrolase/transferase [Arenicellaceae bacterium]
MKQNCRQQGRLALLCSTLLFLPIACTDVPLSEAQSPAVEISNSTDIQSELNRPNILLIVADDMGYSDIGAFGGEIETPNLDALADSGVKFTQFYAASTCSPSRAMLLSGVDNHLAGLGTMRELMLPNQEGQPGYEGYLNHRVVSIATLLQSSGYHTYMTGKWHLGLEEHSSPSARGFEKTFALLHGGANHFDMRGLETRDPIAEFRENGRLLDELPDEYGYSSNFYTQRIIDHISSNQNDKRPFFAYLAFTAPHWPLQAPSEYIEKYRGRYDSGYEILREQRLQGLKERGVVASNVKLPPLPESIKPWSELSVDQKNTEARKMEIYAACRALRLGKYPLQ